MFQVELKIHDCRMKSTDRMSGSDEGSGTPDLDSNISFWHEDDEEIEVDDMHLGSEESGGKRSHSKIRQGNNYQIGIESKIKTSFF